MGNKVCSCFQPKVEVEPTGRRPGLFKNIKVRIFGGKKDATVAIETSATTQDETIKKEEEVLGKMERASLFCVTPNCPTASCNARALPIEQRARSAHKATASMLPHQKLVPKPKVAVAVPDHTEEQTNTDNIQTTTLCQTEPAQSLIADSVLDDDIQNKKAAILTTACKSTTNDDIVTKEPGKDNKDNANKLIKTSDLAACVPVSTENFEPKTRIPECKCAPTISADKTLTDSDYYGAFDNGNYLTDNVQIDRGERQHTSSNQTALAPAYTEKFGSQTGLIHGKGAPNFTADDTTTDYEHNATFDLGKDLTHNNDGLNSTTNQLANLKVSTEDFELQTVIADRKKSVFDLTVIETTSKNDKDTKLDHSKYPREKNVEQTTTTEQSVPAQSSKEDTEPNRNRDIPERKAESTNTNDITITNKKNVVASAIRKKHINSDPKENMTFERVESTHVNNTKVFPSPMCFTTTTTFTTGKITSSTAPGGISNISCKDGVYGTKPASDIPKNILNVPRGQENKAENVINGKNSMHVATTTIFESNLATRTSASYKGMTDTTTPKGNNETTSDQRKDIAQNTKKTIERGPSKGTSTDRFINTLEKKKISKVLSEIPTFKAGNSGTSNVLQTSFVFDKPKPVRSAEVSISGKEKEDNDMRKVASSHTPSVSSTEALETLRKLAKMLAAAKASADQVRQSKLSDGKNSAQLVKQLYERPASSMSHTTATSFTTATTKTSVQATDQLPFLSCSNNPPKAEKAVPMKPSKIKPQPKHLYAVPTIAKTDIEHEAKKNWAQHDSTSDKAQMPWMSRRPQFDITIPKTGKTLLQSLGSVDKILAHRVVPLPKRIELLKVEFGRFPGLRIKPKDVRKYPSIFNLTPSQTYLHEETDEHKEGR